MSTRNAGHRKLTRGANFFLVAVLALGVLILINALAYRHFFRIDLTATKKYTISDATKKVLGDLDDIVNIKVYLSRKLPPYMAPLTNQVKDMLDEYRVYGRGNIAVDYIDPADDPALEQKLRFMGIPQLRLNIMEKDQAAIAAVYMGLAILYRDGKEVIPALTDLATLEYDLTGKILRVQNAAVKTIGFLTGHGEPALESDLTVVNRELREQYYTRTVATADGEPVPPEVSVLVVATPRSLSDRELFAIDQYLMGGGKAVFLMDGVEPQERSMQGVLIDSPAAKLLEHYGVKLLPELVLDQLCATASFQSGPYSVMIPYPFWVRVIGQNAGTDNPIVSTIEAVVMPWASPLELDQDKTAGLKADVLAKSSDYSWTMKDYFDLTPREDMAAPDESTMRGQVLAVALSGSFTSYFADRPVPPAPQDGKAGKEAAPAGKAAQKNAEKPKPAKDGAAANNDKTAGETEVIKKSPETRIVVAGNARFVTDSFITQFDGNRAFLLNAIDWCTADDALMGIRARQSGDSPLYVMSDTAKTAVRAVNMLAMPALVALLGLVLLYLRRRRKSRAAKEL